MLFRHLLQLGYLAQQVALHGFSHGGLHGRAVLGRGGLQDLLEADRQGLDVRRGRDVEANRGAVEQASHPEEPSRAEGDRGLRAHGPERGQQLLALHLHEDMPVLDDIQPGGNVVLTSDDRVLSPLLLFQRPCNPHLLVRVQGAEEGYAAEDLGPGDDPHRLELLLTDGLHQIATGEAQRGHVGRSTYRGRPWHVVQRGDLPEEGTLRQLADTNASAVDRFDHLARASLDDVQFVADLPLNDDLVPRAECPRPQLADQPKLLLLGQHVA
mmetsp:Transcript_81009/g.203933  ORF Transcript_81009/g.203933 Transcript_81009/m.203933 type:complete len:269 (+) Transcript_81009:1315-2121(+)